MLDKSEIVALRSAVLQDGPLAELVVPNPIDATDVVNIQSSDSRLMKVLGGYGLPDLLSPTRLESSLFKIRLHEMSDDPSILAKPNDKGRFNYSIEDPHYSEAMAYYSLTSILHYIEALGFSMVKTRPVYVMVHSKSEDDSQSVNAFYLHNYLNPSQPRTLNLYGDTQWAPGKDRDIYWHEFGHYLNESVSRESGIDFAGDSGAAFTEGAALHECLADHFAESLSDRGYVGRWLARNFSNIPAGSPLRTAETANDGKDFFKDVSVSTDNQYGLDRYVMAEWCTRVLWRVRKQFVAEDPATGAIYSDQLVLAALSMLKKDTSVSQLRTALLSADKSMHCGLHSKSIEKAFSDGGFPATPDTILAPLYIKAAPLLSKDSSGTSTQIEMQFSISNTSGATARNVRVYLESPDGAIIPVTYMQGFGDLPPGKSIIVGGDSGMPTSFSVSGTVKSLPAKYRVRVKAENAPDGITEGVAR